MKTTIRKSIILFTVFILFVAAVAVFIFTIVKPPTELECSSTARFEKNIQDELNHFSNSQDEISLEQSYQRFTDLVKYYFEEGCIDAQKQTQKKNAFFGKYIPLYVQFCDGKFSQNVWYESDHKAMLSRIAELEGNSLTSNQTGELNRVKAVITDYNDAKELVRNTSFNSVESIKNRLQKANEYKQSYPLTQCSDLQAKLNDFPKKLENSHYNYVSGKINAMSRYNDCDVDDWGYRSYKYNCYVYKQSFADPANKAIDEYKSITDPNWSNASQLRNRYNDYYDDANYFFKYYRDEYCLD